MQRFHFLIVGFEFCKIVMGQAQIFLSSWHVNLSKQRTKNTDLQFRGIRKSSQLWSLSHYMEQALKPGLTPSALS